MVVEDCYFCFHSLRPVFVLPSKGECEIECGERGGCPEIPDLKCRLLLLIIATCWFLRNFICIHFLSVFFLPFCSTDSSSSSSDDSPARSVQSAAVPAPTSQLLSSLEKEEPRKSFGIKVQNLPVRSTGKVWGYCTFLSAAVGEYEAGQLKFCLVVTAGFLFCGSLLFKCHVRKSKGLS